MLNRPTNHRELTIEQIWQRERDSQLYKEMQRLRSTTDQQHTIDGIPAMILAIEMKQPSEYRRELHVTYARTDRYGKFTVCGTPSTTGFNYGPPEHHRPQPAWHLPGCLHE